MPLPALPPTTPLALRARDLLYSSCEQHVIDHSERSFQFAALLAAAEHAELDHEVLYIGTILHDIALSPRSTAPVRFEVRGANEVRTMLLDAGMERARAETVWDVIALHTSRGIAAHKSAETAFANRGISIDILAAGAESLAPAEVRAILDAFPRVGFVDGFTNTLVAEVCARPEVVRLSWMEGIAAKHVPGYVVGDFLDTLGTSRGFV